MKTVVGIFESEHIAKEAIEDLRSAGFETISLLQYIPLKAILMKQKRF